MRIEKATIQDTEILTQITKKSKAYWGYSEQQMAKWNDNLTITQIGLCPLWKETFSY